MQWILKKDVFKKDPKKIAASITKSVEKSKRKRARLFQPAMSTINFYENRAGRNLPSNQIKVLEKAKE